MMELCIRSGSQFLRHGLDQGQQLQLHIVVPKGYMGQLVHLHPA